MSKVFFHIGLPKTATTFLQHFFYKNKDALLSENVFYPESLGKKNHIYLSVKCAPLGVKRIIQRNELKSWGQIQKSFFNEVVPHIKDGRSILLSNELLSCRVHRIDNIRKLETLSEKLGVEPKIVIYLRRQDKLLVSLYSTMVKGGYRDPISLELNPWYFDYNALLRRWESIFGRENIIVRIFEKDQMIDQNILNDFLNILKINNISKFKFTNNHGNLSLGRHQIGFLSYLNNEEFLEVPKRKAIVKILSEKTDNSDKIMLSKQSILNILSRYDFENESVAKKYLNRKDGKLFSEPVLDFEEDRLPVFDAGRALEYFRIVFQYL